MFLIICFSLLSVAGIAKAVSDKISFHYQNSIFSKPFFDPFYWNPMISWRNKYKINDLGLIETDLKTGRRVPRFFLSTSALVFLTDAWHLCQFFYINSLVLLPCFVLKAVIGMSLLWTIGFFVVFRSVVGIMFNLFYEKILEKRNE